MKKKCDKPLNNFRNGLVISSGNSNNSKELIDSTANSFFIPKEVTKGKKQAFKIKCESAVQSTGLSKEKFYNKAEFSRQRWYFWSWGLEPFPSYIKIRLCDLFGKPFRDLFLGDEKK